MAHELGRTVRRGLDEPAPMARRRPARRDLAALTIGGDSRTMAAVRAVVAKLPAPVAWHVVRAVYVRCIGVRGRCSQAIRWPDREIFVELTTADEATAMHELAHSWAIYVWPAAARLDPAETERHRRGGPGDRRRGRDRPQGDRGQPPGRACSRRARERVARPDRRHHERAPRRAPPLPHARRDPSRHEPRATEPEHPEEHDDEREIYRATESDIGRRP